MVWRALGGRGRHAALPPLPCAPRATAAAGRAWERRHAVRTHTAPNIQAEERPGHATGRYGTKSDDPWPRWAM